MTAARETPAAPGLAAERTGVSAWIFVGVTVLALVGSLFGFETVISVAAVLLAAFVLLEFRRVPRAQQVAALVLVTVTAVLAGGGDEVLEAVVNGLIRTLPFVLIFASVGWLQSAARESPSVQALREGLMRLGPGQRFSALNLSSHFLGAGFNLAGLALLAPMLDDQRESTDRMRMACAIIWGFAAATCWSPFYVGTAVVLSALPQTSWIEVAPLGFLIAVGFLGYAFVYDRLVRRRGRPRVAGTQSPAVLARPGLRVLVAIAVLFAMTTTLIEGFDLRLTDAVVIAAPSYALGWLFLVHGRRGADRIATVARGVAASYPRMRSETTLFFCANMFGFVMTGIVSGDQAAALSLPQLPGPFFVHAVLAIWLYLVVCAIGIHPIVSVVVFTTVFSPEQLGIAPVLLAPMLMALWGMGTSVSPLSGTTLIMAQLTGRSSFTIGWRWDGTFYALGAVGLAALVSLLR